MEYSTKHLAYLRRTELDDVGERLENWPTAQDVFVPDPASLRLLHVKSICRFWEEGMGGNEEALYNYRTLDVMSACWGSGIPVVYLVLGGAAGIRVLMGTVATPGLDPPQTEDEPATAVIQECLLSQYPGADVCALDEPDLASLSATLSEFPFCGAVNGLPVNKRTEEIEDPTQIDRLIRTMQGSDWGLMVIAQPLAPKSAITHYNQTMNEMRRVQNAEPQPSPMAGEYLGLLDAYKGIFSAATASGLWSTMAYCFARHRGSFMRLKAALNLCYGGSAMMIDPMRVTPIDALRDVMPRFGQVVTPAGPAPGAYQRPLFLQTSMGSDILGCLVHMPRQEMPGFIVRDQARFDVAPHEPAAESAVELGEILDRGRLIGDHYRVSRRA